MRSGESDRLAATQRLTMWLLEAFAAVALLLTVVALLAS
jgi:hypothetical protein